MELLKKGELEERTIEIDATPPRQPLNMEGSPQGMQVHPWLPGLRQKEPAHTASTQLGQTWLAGPPAACGESAGSLPEGMSRLRYPWQRQG